MKTLVISFVVVVAALFVGRSWAEETPEFPVPEKEHAWLKQFVGQWDAVSESVATPAQPAMTCKGQWTSRMLGGFWVVSEMQADMQGTEMHAIQTIGYDPARKKYIGTWVDSMNNHMWVYEGTVDSSGKTLDLEADGPNFMTPGKTSRFKDSYTFESPDKIVLTSSMRDDDGKWVTFMKGTMTRKK